MLARQSPVAGELRSIVGAFRVIADIDRMSSLALHIAKLARRRHPAAAVPADVAGYFTRFADHAVQIGSQITNTVRPQ